MSEPENTAIEENSSKELKEQDNNTTVLATEIPEYPNEITIFQAAGLIPKLSGKGDDEALIARLRIHDPVVRVAALLSLLKTQGHFSFQSLNVAMHVARRSSAVRQKLIPVLLRIFRFELVDSVIEMEKKASAQKQATELALMHALVNNDFKKQIDAHVQLFLDSGESHHILKASEIARERLPWREAWIHALRPILVTTSDPEAQILHALNMLERESAREQFEALGRVICKMEGAKLAKAYAIGQVRFWRKDYQGCLDFLHESKGLEITQEHTATLTSLAAKCCEKLEKFEDAAHWYDVQNKALAEERYDPDKLIENLKTKAAYKIGELPEDSHSNYFIMCGFPRSGTTLLENALNSHPGIATCEETSSLVGSQNIAFSSPIEQDPKGNNLTLRALLNRQLYYKNLKRFVLADNPEVVIDKTPIMSANIKYMEKIFPNKKYIFSIRHPYDVVLSNFKQSYRQNIAMSAFNDMYKACVLYNHVMTDWFEVFPGETDRVYYVYYQELVNDFERVIRGALEFLGVDWTDEVLNFAEHSSRRAVRTPSYANVRKGLTIGVQTSYENYMFMFDDACQKLLDPWVKRFGYEK